jgi:hypothetical protein
MRPPVFFAVLTGILALPLFALGPHMWRLMGEPIPTIITLFVRLLTPQTDPDVRRSKRTVLTLAIYFTGLMAAWITYAEMAGI